MTAKLEDVQEVNVQFAADAAYKQVTVTHNLKDNKGNILVPDSVNTEIVAGDTVDLMYITGIKITRSDPEDGTFILEVVLSGNDANAPLFVLRVTSLVWHSIQGDDHTP